MKKLLKFVMVVALALTMFIVIDYADKEIDIINVNKEYDSLRDNNDIKKEEVVINHDYFLNINEDYDGWIYQKDSPINYPVVSPNDNNKYIKRTFEGKESWSGAPFLDYRGNSRIKHVHAHNYGNLSEQFGYLANYYLDREFHRKHSDFQYITKDKTESYRVFAVLNISAYDEEFNYLDGFNSGETYDRFIKYVRDNNLIEEFDIGDNPKIMTMSTCYYVNHPNKDGRLVVLTYQI